MPSQPETAAVHVSIKIADIAFDNPLLDEPFAPAKAEIIEHAHVRAARDQRFHKVAADKTGASASSSVSGSYSCAGIYLFSTNQSNGLSAYRMPGQVLYLAYRFMAGVTSGGFFPMGVNGVLNTSTAPATSANLS